jgi:hypothetical protein
MSFDGDSPTRFEIADNQGSTLQNSGSVGTVPIVFPDPAQTPISEFLIQCPEGQAIDNRLLVSINGTDFLTLGPSGHWAWTPKGGSVTQLTIKGNIVTGVLYELVMNLEVD